MGEQLCNHNGVSAFAISYELYGDLPRTAGGSMDTRSVLCVTLVLHSLTMSLALWADLTPHPLLLLWPPTLVSLLPPHEIDKEEKKVHENRPRGRNYVLGRMNY